MSQQLNSGLSVFTSGVEVPLESFKVNSEALVDLEGQAVCVRNSAGQWTLEIELHERALRFLLQELTHADEREL